MSHRDYPFSRHRLAIHTDQEGHCDWGILDVQQMEHENWVTVQSHSIPPAAPGSRLWLKVEVTTGDSGTRVFRIEDQAENSGLKPTPFSLSLNPNWSFGHTEATKGGGIGVIDIRGGKIQINFHFDCQPIFLRYQEHDPILFVASAAFSHALID